MLNRDQSQDENFRRVCPRCGKNCGSFAEYCENCGEKLPLFCLSETEIKEWLELSALILGFFGGWCGLLLHSFLQQNPEVIFCPYCGKNLRSTVVN